MISTKGRYALRVLIDLAEHQNGAFLPMKEVAARQELSLKYLERITPILVRGGLMEGQHGKGGGCRLARDPGEITVWQVLELTEGDLAPIACLEAGAPPCPRAARCRTLPMWEEYHRLTRDYFSRITLADLMDRDRGDEYVI